MRSTAVVPHWVTLTTDTGRSIYLYLFNPMALVFLVGPLVFLRRRGRSAGYLFCFSLFFLYLWTVCHYAICPLPIDADLIEWMSEVQTWRERVNLVPTFFDPHFYWSDLNVTGNFWMGVPFGLGVPFVVSEKHRAAGRALLLCFAFAAGLELAQLAISLVFYGFPYRSIDVDDVIFVFGGTLVGHAVFRAGAAVDRWIGWEGGARWPVWSHLHEVLFHGGARRDGRGRSQDALSEVVGDGQKVPVEDGR